MALQAIKHLDKIGGYKIVRVKPADMSWDDYDKLRDEFPINITEKLNTISFKIQHAPVSEVGRVGCDVSTLIHATIAILSGLNQDVPSSHTTKAIGHLNLAVAALEKRTEDRVKRGVEGTMKS